ncbi:MAG: F0F1 ATP synthase subunit B [Clostridiales bacterium]|nr:F0F1 ATP synthase subunit B [Clostridiales bacterium]
MEIHPDLLIFAIINFLILVFALYRFLWKPYLKMLDDRKEKISESLSAAEAATEDAKATKAALQAEIARARAQADSLLSAAQKNSEETKRDIIAQAKLEAQRLTEKAKAEIQREKEAAIMQIKQEIASLAVAAAARILKDEMNDDLQKKLTDKYIQEVGRVQ